MTSDFRIDLGLSVRDLLARALVQMLTRHTEPLLVARASRPCKGSVADHFDARFRGWAKHPHRSKIVLALDHNHARIVSSTALARTLGLRDRQPVRDVVRELRGFYIPVYNAAGQEEDFFPFKKGREFWDQRTLKREGETRIDGGIRMTLSFRPQPKPGDALAMQDALLPNILSELEVFEGAATIIETDAAMSAEQRDALQRRCDEITGRVRARVAGPQLALPNTGTK